MEIKHLRFRDEFVRWLRYAKSSVHERKLTEYQAVIQWQKQLSANPYTLSAKEYLFLRENDFPFVALDARWMDRYAELGCFRQQHGHCLVHARSSALGQWASRQRSFHKKGILSPQRELALNRLEFCWDINALFWQQRFDELQAFIEKEGHMRVPQTVPYLRLAHWIDRVRASRQNLTPFQHQQLNQIGFVWRPYSARWKMALEELKRFVRNHGHADVPHLCRRYPKAAALVDHQRRLYRAGTIDPARRQALEELGVRWTIIDTIWEERYQELSAVHQRFGHVRMPKDWPENKRLERWLRSQREHWQRLSADHRDRLATLGIHPEYTESPHRRLFREHLIKVLEEAGPHGMKVEDIARRLGAKRYTVTAWFCQSPRRRPEIKKIKRGWYALNEAAELTAHIQ